MPGPFTLAIPSPASVPGKIIGSRREFQTAPIVYMPGASIAFTLTVHHDWKPSWSVTHELLGVTVALTTRCPVESQIPTSWLSRRPAPLSWYTARLVTVMGAVTSNDHPSVNGPLPNCVPVAAPVKAWPKVSA